MELFNNVALFTYCAYDVPITQSDATVLKNEGFKVKKNSEGIFHTSVRARRVEQMAQKLFKDAKTKESDSLLPSYLTFGGNAATILRSTGKKLNTIAKNLRSLREQLPLSERVKVIAKSIGAALLSTIAVIIAVIILLVLMSFDAVGSMSAAP